MSGLLGVTGFPRECVLTLSAFLSNAMVTSMCLSGCAGMGARAALQTIQRGTYATAAAWNKLANTTNTLCISVRIVPITAYNVPTQSDSNAHCEASPRPPAKRFEITCIRGLWRRLALRLLSAPCVSCHPRARWRCKRLLPVQQCMQKCSQSRLPPHLRNNPGVFHTLQLVVR